MQTFPIEVVREAFHTLIPFGTKVKISVFNKDKKPHIFVCKVGTIHAHGKEGWKISFYKVNFHRKMFPDISIPVHQLRWITNPLDLNELEKWCITYTKKLTAGMSSYQLDT